MPIPLPPHTDSLGRCTRATPAGNSQQSGARQQTFLLLRAAEVLPNVIQGCSKIGQYVCNIRRSPTVAERDVTIIIANGRAIALDRREVEYFELSGSLRCCWLLLLCEHAAMERQIGKIFIKYFPLRAFDADRVVGYPKGIFVVSTGWIFVSIWIYWY